MSKRKHKWLPVICWAYLIVLAICYALMRVDGEGSLSTTMLLFGPRWALAIPFLILTPLCFWLYRKALWSLLLAALLMFGPIMGLCAPIPFTGKSPAANNLPIRVLALNSHHIPFDSPELAEVVRRTHPDLISIEECAKDWNGDPFGEKNFYHFKHEAEFVILSRWPIESIKSEGWRTEEYEWRAFRIITPKGPLHFFSVHLASPHQSLAKTLRQTPDWYKSLANNRHAREIGAMELKRMVNEMASVGPSIMAGDFNLPVESTIYSDNLGDFNNAFSKVGWGYGISYHHLLTTTRIDHILASKNITPIRCWTEHEVGSPHLPLMADLRWDLR